ncbi:MAG: OmpA family protein [Microscillaceae bacterium]|nr:OmpA family protein [Microscillaceae bacterium]MDW8461898.1 OmpA family protein [Cytophagales bacterium]
MNKKVAFWLLIACFSNSCLLAQPTPTFNSKQFLTKIYSLKDSLAVGVKKGKKILRQNIIAVLPKARKAAFTAMSFLIHYNINNLPQEVLDDTLYAENEENPLFAGVYVRNLGKEFNSEFDDYAPVLANNDSVLVFTSRRKGASQNNISWLDNSYFEDIYISRKTPKGWSEPQQFSPNINSEYHDASLFIPSSGKELYIYRDKNRGDIYVSHYDSIKREWEKPIALPKPINSPYAEYSLCLTESGNTIYFASDRPGGYGGIDLYMTTKDEKGKWSEPINLGPNVNTMFDEDSPFLAANNRLFFSSKGHDALGGYDIFYTEFVNGEWAKPKSLGKLVNTIDNEVHFVISKDQKVGYFASTRATGFGGEDIYEVRFFQKKAKQEEVIAELKPEVGSKIILNIFFDSEQTNIQPEYFSIIEHLCNFLREYPYVKIEISGHTDSRGVPEHNKVISEKRAKAVVDVLIAQGVSPDRLSFVGYGADRPIAPNTTEAGRAFNRRIECTIVQVE